MKFSRSLSCALAVLISPLSYAQGPARDDLVPAPLTREEIDAAASELGLSEADLFRVADPMTKAERERVEREVEVAMQDLGTLSRKADAALALMIKTGTWALERKGFHAEAAELRKEYTEFYSNAVYYTYLGVEPADLGDHLPLSQWLAKVYDQLEALLGETLCKLLHLYDIKIMNFGLPVVFKPEDTNQWCLETMDVSCRTEYRYHFAGKMKNSWLFEHYAVSGVVAYWTVWGVCVGATWGAGAITLICSPVGMVSEYAISRWVAPPLSNFIFDRVNAAL